MYKASILIGIFLFSTFAFATRPADEFVYLGCPSWQAEFDTAGYADCIYWGNSTIHPYNSHEMLSGEYGAAIYYNGITNNKSMWLTNYFLYPFWTTNSNFDFIEGDSWDDTNNPLTPFYGFETNYHGPHTAYDTARSIIGNNDVNVTINYKMIDLGDSNYASLPFYPEGSSTVAYAKSERYILLQTYNIKNTHSVGGSSITGLKFYQMLVSLVASPFQNISKSSTYSDANVPGLLAGSFDPCNPNSPPSFRYAITQWNAGYPVTQHVDWESFSSTIEPNYFA